MRNKIIINSLYLPYNYGEQFFKMMLDSWKERKNEKKEE